jgi:quercetin dioxygenase-like cupin family protein
MQRRERRHVPVTMGSPEFRTIETNGFIVTDAWFPPGAVLPRHTHDRAIFATMLEGRLARMITVEPARSASRWRRRGREANRR